MSDDNKTVYYNSMDANRVFRICIEEGCTTDQAENIAIKVGAAEARSFTGRAEKIVKDNILKGLGVALVVAGGAVAGWFGLGG